MMLSLLWLLVFTKGSLGHVYNAVETEMFAIPISPNLFNWTYQEFDQQYRFHASLIGKPELPSWLRYIYSGRHHSGFIFGTPPRNIASPITIEVIGLNRQDYETRRVLLNLKVHPKENMAKHEVELKIDNLNVEDVLDEHRMTRLKDILRTKLWTESSKDLYPTFLASAIDLGARLPLKPSDGEGLVVRLGSSMPFSSELKRLREEVRPLSRLPSCPREYKRTTVERLFRDAGFTLDWCSFELYNIIYKERTTQRLEYLTEVPNAKNSNQRHLDTHMWSAPHKASLPKSIYWRQVAATVVAPLLLLVLCVATFSFVLCAHCAVVAHNAARLELCRYGTDNTEQTQVPDDTRPEDTSHKSVGVSPNSSLTRPYSPKSTTNLAANFNRPQPPPYNTNSIHNRKTDKPTPERAHLALEESIKLLNQANISKYDVIHDKIVDIADGCDDYVPINPDLDDIVVPELAKYGISGVGQI